jgi:hypothetical protein
MTLRWGAASRTRAVKGSDESDQFVLRAPLKQRAIDRLEAFGLEAAIDLIAGVQEDGSDEDSGDRHAPLLAEPL